MRCLLSKYNNEITPPDTLIFSVLQIYHKITRQRVNETTSKDSLLISINTNFNHPTFNFTPSTPLLPFNPSYPFHTLHPFPTSLHHSITPSLKKTHQCVFIFIGIIDTSLLVDSLTCWLVDLYKLHHFITSSLKKTLQCVFIFIGIIDTSLHHFITPLHPLSLYTFPDIINNLK